MHESTRLQDAAIAPIILALLNINMKFLIIAKDVPPERLYKGGF
jgi:hypothetical protein